VRALIKSQSSWKIRAVTRDPSSDDAKSIASLDKSVEIFEGNEWNEGEMKKAFTDAHAVFSLTDYYVKKIVLFISSHLIPGS